MNDTASQLAKHEEWIKLLMSSSLADTGTKMQERAESMATFEALCAIVDHLGIDRREFVSQHNERKKYWHDLFLRGAETVDQNLGAMMDQRSPEEVSTISDEEGFPGGIPPELSFQILRKKAQDTKNGDEGQGV